MPPELTVPAKRGERHAAFLLKRITCNGNRTIQPARVRTPLAEGLGRGEAFRDVANDDPRPKYYVLEMFPYPSGRIHMGHVRNYAMGDVVARFRRAMGYNVLHPMGWDAFGLPAENAARDNKVNPRDWTYANIATMKAQLKTMGLSLDWSREIATCDPELLQASAEAVPRLLAAGLVERKSAKVNWDPVDMTVLANEQVIDGRGWRSGALVEQRDLTQWFFKITAMAQELLDGLDTLDRWPEKVRLMQQNWIGRSEGLLIRWPIAPGTAPAGETRAGGLHDAARHDLRRVLHGDRRRPSAGAARPPRATRRWPAFIDEVHHMGTSLAALETAEKKGFDTGIRVVHPFDPDWTLPVYVANFVLMDYGTGAIFGCPSGDQRDLDFANKYGLPVIPVVMPDGADAATFQIIDEAYVDDGVMINSRFLDGMKPQAAFDEVARLLEQRSIGNRPMGERKVQFRLRDWLISRQRYWGCPIPVIHCDACGARAGARRRPAGRAADRRHLRQARQSARPSPDLEACRLPAMRQAGAARHRHDGHVRRFVLVFRALHRSVERDSSRRRFPASTARAAGCRSTSISAASSTRSCICSIRASSPAP